MISIILLFIRTSTCSRNAIVSIFCSVLVHVQQLPDQGKVYQGSGISSLQNKYFNKKKTIKKKKEEEASKLRYILVQKTFSLSHFPSSFSSMFLRSSLLYPFPDFGFLLFKILARHQENISQEEGLLKRKKKKQMYLSSSFVHYTISQSQVKKHDCFFFFDCEEQGHRGND